MTQPNDEILVKPGAAGDPNIAVHTVGGKKFQAVMQANSEGHILGSLPSYSAWSGVQAAGVNKVYWHLFNAAGSGKLVKVRKLFIQPSGATNALVAQNWRLSKTNAVGTTGNSPITIRAHDSANAAVPAQITAAHSFTAGGTDAFTYWEAPFSVEETQAGVHMLSFRNILPVEGEYVQDYTLREGEGLKLTNITGGAYSYSALGVFTVE